MFKDIETLLIDSQSIKAVEYWPLLKHELVRKSNKGARQGLQYKSSSTFRLIMALLLSFINLFRARFSSLNIAFFGASSRAVIQSGEVKDEFLSEDKLAECSLLYHCSNYEKISLKTAFKNRIVFENLLMKLFTIIRGAFISKESASGKYFPPHILVQMKDNYGLSASEIDLIIHNFEKQKSFYTSLLRFMKVKQIFLISSYTKAASISSANMLNIETIELQHGLVAPYHPCYSFSGSCNWKSSLLPNRLLLNSSFWLPFMSKSNFVGELDVEVSTLAPDVNYKEVDDYCYSLRASDGYAVFTGQGISYDKVFAFFKDFMQLNPTIKLVYRPHPREHLNYKKYTDNMLSSNFLVVDRDSYADTKKLILGAKAHISIFSSCHFEAIELLHKTYVLDIIENNLMEVGRGDESIVFFKSAHELSLN